MATRSGQTDALSQVVEYFFNKGDTRVPADNGDLSLKDEDVRDNETYIKDNDSKFGGN